MGDDRRPEWLQIHVRRTARVQRLRLRDDTQHLGVPVSPEVGAAEACRHEAGDIQAGDCRGAGTAGANLVNVCGHDAQAVVVAPVRVPVALVLAAKLEEVITTDQRQVITEDMIVAVPVALASVLRAHAIGDERVAAHDAAGGTFSADLHRAAQARELGHRRCRRPLPKIAQIVVAEVVGELGTDVRGEARDEIPGHLWALRRGRRRAESSAEQTPHVILVVGETLQMIIAIAGQEMPFRSKVMIEARNSKVVVLRQLQAGQIALSVEAVARRGG